MKNYFKALACTFAVIMGVQVVADTEPGEFLPRLVGVWLIAIPVHLMAMKIFEDRERATR